MLKKLILLLVFITIHLTQVSANNIVENLNIKLIVTKMPDLHNNDNVMQGKIDGCSGFENDFKLIYYVRYRGKSWYGPESIRITDQRWQKKFYNHPVEFAAFLIPSDAIIPDGYIHHELPKIQSVANLNLLVYWHVNVPNELFTNLQYYPLAGYFFGADEIIINNKNVEIDRFFGFKTNVLLNKEGSHQFQIIAKRFGKIVKTVTVVINRNSKISFEDKILLYIIDDPDNPETIIIDAINSSIVGVLPDIQISGATRNGKYVFDTQANVYSASNHKWIGRLPVNEIDDLFPICNSTDICYVNQNKIALDDSQGSLIIKKLSNFPIKVDNRSAFLIKDNLLAQLDADQKRIFKVNLTTDDIVFESSYWTGKNLVLDCTGKFMLSTYSTYRIGHVMMTDLIAEELIFDLKGEDWIGKPVFYTENIALVPCYGNSAGNEGGVYIVDLKKKAIVSYYRQARTEAVICDKITNSNLVFVKYIPSIYFNTFNNGIDILEFDNTFGTLQFIKHLYLNNNVNSNRGNSFIKSGNPKVKLSVIPNLDNRIQDLEGEVVGVNPKEYVLTALIYIPGVGYSYKPSNKNKVTKIDENLAFSIDLSTEPYDHKKTELQVFLIPKNTRLPDLTDQHKIPVGLFSLSEFHIRRDY